MFLRLHFLFFLFLMPGLLWQCTRTNTDTIPTHVLETDNLMLYPEDAKATYNAFIKRKAYYGKGNDVMIGTIGGITVDDSGRVYINDFQQRSIAVFDSTAKYITTIGREGDGPGEFRLGPYPYIVSNYLNAFDIMSMRLSVFSLSSYELIETLSMNPVNQYQFSELMDSHVHQIFPAADRSFLVSFVPYSRASPTQAGQRMDGSDIRFFLMNKESEIISKQIIQLNQQSYLTGKVDGRIRMATFGFLDKPLVTISNTGNIFTAQSGDFLIKKYTPEGEYVQAFYYPFDHVNMQKEDALKVQATDFLREIVRQNELPKTWPALNDLLIDDENRLWVSTIVEDFDIYEWWVLEETGELISQFEWPRDEPIEVVKNGYMYTRETDEETGLQQIVRYRVEMAEN